MTEFIDFKKFKNLPESPGVYIMRDNAGRIIYIGKAKNLRKRVSSYFRSDVEIKVRSIINSLRHLDYFLAASESEALVVERQLINSYKPFYNALWRDDKSYPYLKLSLKEDFPRLFITRKHLNDGSAYFGPYPQAFQVKNLLSWLHKAFRWRYCRMEISSDRLPEWKKVASCLYLQSGRCPAPCAGKISKKDYGKIVSDLKSFLKGKYCSLVGEWRNEMKALSRNREFEKAAEIRDRIATLEKMSEKVTLREIKPQDLGAALESSRSLEEIKNALNLAKWPVTIEGFDISNTSGTLPVGSMVRFYNGNPDKDNYRRFKIKTVSGIDDTAMLGETVYRRYYSLKNNKAGLPDLILIDGGKGQLSAALESLEKLSLKIPLVSIAKKNEDLFVPGSGAPIKLSKESAGLHLLQAVRDEAHRFAVSYHRQRRSKLMGLD